MVLANKNGLMEQFIKVNGKITKLMVKELLPIRMVIIIKDNGVMTKPRDMESLFIKKLVQDFKAIGKTICNTDPVFKHIVMEINMKECLKMVKEMAKELTTIQQGKFIKEAGIMEE